MRILLAVSNNFPKAILFGYKNTLIEHYSRYIKNEDYTLLNQHVYAAHRFSHELEQYGFRGVFRSTYLSPNKALRIGTGIDELTEELFTHIQLK